MEGKEGKGKGGKGSHALLLLYPVTYILARLISSSSSNNLGINLKVPTQSVAECGKCPLSHKPKVETLAFHTTKTELPSILNASLF